MELGFRTTLAFASLRRHSTRTVLAMLGVAMAAAMLLDMVMLSSGMRESFRRLFLSQGFQLRLSPKGTLPFDTDATIGEAGGIVRLLRTNPGVALVSPVLGASIYVPRDSAGAPAVTSVALGIDPTQQGDYQLLSGRDVTAPNTMVVNDAFLTATGARVGDTLEIASGYDPAVRRFAGSLPLVITGRARFLYTSAGQVVAALPLATLQGMGGPARTDRVSLFMVKARTGVDIEALRDWIEAGVPRVTVVSTQTALLRWTGGSATSGSWR